MANPPADSSAGYIPTEYIHTGHGDPFWENWGSAVADGNGTFVFVHRFYVEYGGGEAVIHDEILVGGLGGAYGCVKKGWI